MAHFLHKYGVEELAMAVKKRKHVENSECLKSYFDQIKKSKLLTFKEEIDLSKRIQDGDKEALDHLVKSNLRLVVKIAMDYRMPEISLLDLIQDGNMGLIKAATKYDYKKNVRFSTYASWWIKQAIMRALSNKRRTIRLPHRKEEKLRKINKIYNLLYQKFMRKPTTEEIAAEMKLAVENVTTLLNCMNTVVSFDKENCEDSLTLHELYEDYSYNPDKQLMKKCLKEETMKFLENLMEKEKQILLYRFSFLSGRKYTLKSIGEKLGISPETVRQIELKALRKLKKVAHELKEYSFN